LFLESFLALFLPQSQLDLGFFGLTAPFAKPVSDLSFVGDFLFRSSFFVPVAGGQPLHSGAFLRLFLSGLTPPSSYGRVFRCSPNYV